MYYKDEIFNHDDADMVNNRAGRRKRKKLSIPESEPLMVKEQIEHKVYVTPRYNHKEAYCLMKYKCTCGYVETLWNSQDNVTPFMIKCPKCKNYMTHIEWSNDRCVPDYTPPIGSRIFVKCSFQDAYRTAKLQYAIMQKHRAEMEAKHQDKTFPTEDYFIPHTMEQLIGSPIIKTVDEELLAKLGG